MPPIAAHVAGLDPHNAANIVQPITFATPNDPRLEDGFFWLFQPLQSLTEVVTFIVGGSVYVPRTADVILHQNSLTRQDFVLDSYQSFISVHLR